MYSEIKKYIEKNKKEDTVLCIYGPTASGKTALSIQIAKDFNGEIISADSRILYEGMIIGTAAPTKEEMEGIPHYFVNNTSPEKIYTLKDYQKKAYGYIKDILKRGKLPIIIGGTNLYIDAITEGYSVTEYVIDKHKKKEIQQMTDEEKFKKLKKLDPDTASIVDPNNIRHFIRKLEYCIATGKKYSENVQKIKPDFFTPLEIGIKWERDALYERINKRVYAQIESGLIEETKQLLKKYPEDHPAMTGIGYKQVIMYLKGELNMTELIDLLQKVTRNYTKRQLTWLRKKKNIQWFLY